MKITEGRDEVEKDQQHYYLREKIGKGQIKTKNVITAKRKGISQLIVGPKVVEKKVKDEGKWKEKQGKPSRRN